jgi:hypothetical protein
VLPLGATRNNLSPWNKPVAFRDSDGLRQIARTVYANRPLAL